jgi:ABC-type Zn uptake system ZnuABC Zn-binding protein ZnuA
MSKNAATEEVLGDLHARVATVMIGALNTVEKAQQAYNELEPEQASVTPMPEVSASLLSAMTKFLADNKITCNPAEDNKTSALAEKLAKRRKSVGNVVPFVADED